MVTGSRSMALPPGSASRQRPDPSAPPPRRKFRIKIMARQPDDKTAAKSKSDDSALIRELALLLDETNLTEIEIERAGLRVRVARNVSIAATMPARYQPAGAPAAGPAPVADIGKHPGVVPSPMVGTVYWAS